MERQAVAQAQEFLRRYNLYPATDPSAVPSSTPNEPTQSAGNIVMIPVANSAQVENAPIDAFRTFIYPNLENREIHVKKMGDSGKEEIIVYLPKGIELEKEFMDASRKVTESLSSFEERLKCIEEKLDEQSKL